MAGGLGCGGMVLGDWGVRPHPNPPPPGERIIGGCEGWLEGGILMGEMR